MVDEYAQEMDALATRLHYEFHSDATITHDNSDPDDQHVRVTPHDDANADAVLDRIERWLRNRAKDEPDEFLYKLRGDQLHVKIVANRDDEFQDSSWMWI